MTRNVIFDNLKELILTVKPKTDTSKLTTDSLLIRDLGVDSLAMELLTLAVENRFGIKLGDTSGMATVADVIDYIEQQL